MDARRWLLVGTALAALWIGYRYAFPSDELQIRRVLDRIAAALGAAAEGESEVTRLARVAGVRSQLDPQITVDAGAPFSSMHGRDAIIGAIARANSAIEQLAVDFDDVTVSVAEDGRTAQVHLTAEARYRDGGGAPGFDARELDVTLRKVEGDWVVSQVALVRTLQPMTPR